MEIYTILCIAAGGFAGSMLRYGICRAVSQRYECRLPLGTIIVNIIGSLYLGFIMGLSTEAELGRHLFLFLTSGLAGAFTTFSTAMYEQYNLIRDRRLTQALEYFMLTMLIGVIASALGYFTALAILG